MGVVPLSRCNAAVTGVLAPMMTSGSRRSVPLQPQFVRRFVHRPAKIEADILASVHPNAASAWRNTANRFCVSESPSADGISSPIRRTRSCATPPVASATVIALSAPSKLSPPHPFLQGARGAHGSCSSAGSGGADRQSDDRCLLWFILRHFRPFRPFGSTRNDFGCQRLQALEMVLAPDKVD